MRTRTRVLLFSCVVLGLALFLPVFPAQAASRGAMISVNAPFDGRVTGATVDPITGEFSIVGYEDFRGTWEGRAWYAAFGGPTADGTVEFDAIQTFEPNTVVRGCGVGGFQLKEHGYGYPLQASPNGAPVKANWTFIEGSGTGDLSGLRSGDGIFDYIMEPTLSYHDGQTLGTMKCAPPEPHT